MEKRELPSKIVLQNYAGISMLPLVAFFPLVIAIVIFVGMTLTNNASLAEWRIPLLGIASMSLITNGAD